MTPRVAVSTTPHSVKRPRRFGRALRRLLEGHSAVVWHIAQRLEADGLVTCGATEGTASKSAVICTLTESGRVAALAAKEGHNPYALSTGEAKKRTREYRAVRTRSFKPKQETP